MLFPTSRDASLGRKICRTKMCSCNLYLKYKIVFRNCASVRTGLWYPSMWCGISAKGETLTYKHNLVNDEANPFWGDRDDLRQSKIDLPGTSTSSRIGSRLKEIGKTTISGCLKQLPTWCKLYLKKLCLVFFLLSVFSSKFFFLGFFLDLVPNGAQFTRQKTTWVRKSPAKN